MSPRRSRLDKFFGGQPGAAQRALAGLQKRYGQKGGKTVFDARVIKQKKRERRP